MVSAESAAILVFIFLSLFFFPGRLAANKMGRRDVDAKRRREKITHTHTHLRLLVSGAEVVLEMMIRGRR